MQRESFRGPSSMPAWGRAEEAVETHLKIDDFIRRLKDRLFARLEEIFLRVRQQDHARDRFVNDCRPLIGGLIQVGATPQDLRLATTWATDKLCESDPSSTLSNLTFFYLVEQGWREISESGEAARKQLWLEMRGLLAGPALAQ